MKIHQENRHIVVIGGGFAGLNFIKHLHKSGHYRITLVDKNNYNYFTPLIYQVATGFLEPSNVSYPFRNLFKGKGIGFRFASVKKILISENKLILSDGGMLAYDKLVIAAGSRTNFFGNENIRQGAFKLKNVDDALFMRNQLIKVLEKAAIEIDPQRRSKLLTIVIAGGGPTGVEVAGILAEMRENILAVNYPELKNDLIKIYLVDGSPYLLPAMSAKTHQAVFRALEEMNVKIILNSHVTLFENDEVHLSNGQIIPCKSLLWAAGVIANTFEGIDEQYLDSRRRIIVDKFNRIKGHHNIYAIGDICVLKSGQDYPNGHPQLAQPAIQQGRHLARNLISELKGERMKPFKYFDRGDMAIIGRRLAVADLLKHRLHLGGFLGLLSWLFIHLISLVNYNNKIKTLYNWAVAYATRDQALRMIFRSSKAGGSVAED